MSCAPTPNNETTPEELKKLRDGLKAHGGAMASKHEAAATRSAAMGRRAGLAQRGTQRSTRLTLPISSPQGEGLFSVEVTSNSLVYGVVNNTLIMLEETLPLADISIDTTATPPIVHTYSNAVTEGSASVVYATRYMLGSESDLPTVSDDSALDENLLDNKVDADNGKIYQGGAALPMLVSESIVISIFRSEDGGAFTPHVVTLGNWDVSPAATHEEMLIAKDRAPGNEVYPIDPEMPYGYFFKKIRPPGFAKEWKRVATKDYSMALAEAEIPNGIDKFVASRGLTLPPHMRSAIIDGSRICLSFESNGGQLYLPVNRFEIRPKRGHRPVPNINRIDEGPHRTTPQGKVINTPHRKLDTKLFSAGGSYQYVLKTWRGLYRSYGSALGLEPSEGLWLWEARPEAQAWLQSVALVDTFLRWTSGLPAGAEFPAIYIALMAHINNVAPSCAKHFLQGATARIAAQNTTDYRVAHQLCKVEYDAQGWLIRKHLGYFNKARDKMVRELPKRDPTIYLTDPTLFPGRLQ